MVNISPCLLFSNPNSQQITEASQIELFEHCSCGSFFEDKPVSQNQSFMSIDVEDSIRQSNETLDPQPRQQLQPQQPVHLQSQQRLQ